MTQSNFDYCLFYNSYKERHMMNQE
jgi:hypothetical protein